MSWGLAAVTTPVDDLREALSEAVERYVEDNAPASEVVDQLGAAVTAAAIIATSGAVGSEYVIAQVNGHANPEHLPAPGFANDYIQVNVSAAVEPPAELDEDYPDA